MFKINKKEENSQKDKLTFRDIAETTIVSLVISVLFLTFFRFSTVEGISMNKTLADNDKLILNTFLYKHSTPEYDDIIVIKRDDLSVKYLIKRVIGVSGDKIVIKNNQLYRNDELIEENYINEAMETPNMEIVVPNGKLFTMGDNRNNSLDSRFESIGFIDVETQVFGQAIFDITQFKLLI